MDKVYGTTRNHRKMYKPGICEHNWTQMQSSLMFTQSLCNIKKNPNMTKKAKQSCRKRATREQTEPWKAVCRGHKVWRTTEKLWGRLAEQQAAVGAETHCTENKRDYSLIQFNWPGCRIYCRLMMRNPHFTEAPLKTRALVLPLLKNKSSFCGGLKCSRYFRGLLQT